MAAGMFTHQSNDPRAYAQKLMRDTYQSNYNLASYYANPPKPCLANNLSAGNKMYPSYIGRDVNLESVLQGQTRISSKDNKIDMPDPLPRSTRGVRDEIDECNDFLESEYTRYTNPAYEIRGLTTEDLRMEYPKEDPQCHIFESFSVNTRLQEKDNFVPTWNKPLNPLAVWPKTVPDTNPPMVLTGNFASVTQ